MGLSASRQSPSEKELRGLGSKPLTTAEKERFNGRIARIHDSIKSNKRKMSEEEYKEMDKAVRGFRTRYNFGTQSEAASKSGLPELSTASGSPYNTRSSAKQNHSEQYTAIRNKISRFANELTGSGFDLTIEMYDNALSTIVKDIQNNVLDEEEQDKLYRYLADIQKSASQSNKNIVIKNNDHTLETKAVRGFRRTYDFGTQSETASKSGLPELSTVSPSPYNTRTSAKNNHSEQYTAIRNEIFRFANELTGSGFDLTVEMYDNARLTILKKIQNNVLDEKEQYKLYKCLGEIQIIASQSNKNIVIKNKDDTLETKIQCSTSGAWKSIGKDKIASRSCEIHDERKNHFYRGRTGSSNSSNCATLTDNSRSGCSEPSESDSADPSKRTRTVSSHRRSVVERLSALSELNKTEYSANPSDTVIDIDLPDIRPQTPQTHSSSKDMTSDQFFALFSEDSNYVSNRGVNRTEEHEYQQLDKRRVGRVRGRGEISDNYWQQKENYNNTRWNSHGYYNLPGRSHQEHQNHFNDDARTESHYYKHIKVSQIESEPDQVGDVEEPEEEQILDVHELFNDGFDLNSVDNLSYMERIDKLEEYARTFEDPVSNFKDEKHSVPYFVLDEKLQNLVEKLDNIKCKDNQDVTSRKVSVILYRY